MVVRTLTRSSFKSVLVHSFFPHPNSVLEEINLDDSLKVCTLSRMEITPSEQRPIRHTFFGITSPSMTISEAITSPWGQLFNHCHLSKHMKECLQGENAALTFEIR